MRIYHFEDLSEIEKRLFLCGNTEPLNFSKMLGLAWYRDDFYKIVFVEDYDEGFQMQEFLRQIFEYYQTKPTLDDYAGSDE